MCWGTGGYGLEGWAGPWTAIWNSRTYASVRTKSGTRIRPSKSEEGKFECKVGGNESLSHPNASLRRKTFLRLEFVRLVTPKIFVERYANVNHEF